MAQTPLPPNTPSHVPLPADTINALLNDLRQVSADQQTALITQNALAAQVAQLQQLLDAANSPGTPTGLRFVTASTTTITVAWDAIPGANITYIAEIAQNATSNWRALPSTAANTATFTNLFANSVYDVRLHALAGTKAGPVGAILTVQTATATSPPSAPTGLVLVGSPSTTSISVSWNVVANADSYDVGTLVSGTWTSAVTVAGNNATLTSLTASTPYTIQVRGNNGAVHGALSSQLIVTTASAGSAPAQVTGGHVTGVTSNAIDFAWASLGSIGSPPADPGMSSPSLTIAPNTSYTFKNVVFANTAQAGNPGTQSINFYCATGALSCTLIGTTFMRAGANNSAYLGLQGVWADLIATAATVAYKSPVVASGTDTVNMELWVAGGATPSTGAIAVTITAGAATLETGGYNPTGGYTYVPRISGDAGATWTTLAAQGATTVTFTGLTATHSYQMSAHGVNQAGVAGPESVVTTQVTTATQTIKGDPTGVQAARAADVISSAGPNIYPLNGQDGGNPNQLAAQFDYIWGGTGHRPQARIYTHPSDGPAFVAFMQGLINTNKVLVVVCTDTFGNTSNAGAIYVCQHLSPNDIAFYEGLNEPDYGPGAPPGGFGPYGQATILASQQSAYAALHPLGIKCYGASILYTCQDEVNFWNATGQKATYLAVCDGISKHLYPGWGCFSASNMLHDWTDTSGLNNLPVAITEEDYALYNTQGGPYPQANYETVTGWLTLSAWMIGYFKYNVRGWNHWSMNDFTNEGFFPVGLFVNSAANPHRYTTQIAAFVRLLTDLGVNARTFQTGKINVTVTGLPAGSWINSGGQCFWIQVSNGDFFGIVLNEQNQQSGAIANVHFAFGSNCLLVEDYGITNPDGSQNSRTPAPRSSVTNVTQFDMALGTEFRVLRVRKP